jgi:DNA-binding NtrC family response regulator
MPKTENISRPAAARNANSSDLPRGVDGGAIAFPHRDMPRPDTPLRGLDVLVVEDEPDALDALQQALEFFGARVGTADSVAEARRRIQAAPPDVVVTDISLGAETGIDLLAWLRTQPSARINGVPTIAITGHPRYMDLPSAEAFADWLVKPLRADALCAAILRAASVRDGHRERRRA